MSDMSTTWPPTLEELKTRMKIDLADDREDDRLTQDLDAAIDYVQDVRPGFKYDPDDPAQIDLPEPTARIKLGTLMAAARWQNRIRSPDFTVANGDLGTARVPSFDADVDRLLRIGRYRQSVIA